MYGSAKQFFQGVAGAVGAGGEGVRARKNRRARIRQERFDSFASVYRSTENGKQWYMTPIDFMNALTVHDLKNKYEQEISLDHYKEKVTQPGILNTALNTLHSDYQKSGNILKPLTTFSELALLSYYDYVLLLTILSKSEEHFRLAFKLIDENNDDTLELTEYNTLESFVLHDSIETVREPISIKDMVPSLQAMDVTASEADNQPGGTSGCSEDYPNLVKLIFFGPGMDYRIGYDKFRAFATGIHHEILEEEFHGLMEQEDAMDLIHENASKDDVFTDGDTSGLFLSRRVRISDKTGEDDDHDDGYTISAGSFAIAVLRNTKLPPDQIEVRIQKIEEQFPDSRITLKQFIDFHTFLLCLNDFATGLQFLEQQQHKIGPEEFAHAIKITTSVQLSETMVSVIYSIFDVDGDKNLTYKEIMSIMKSRLDRGMRAHMDNVKMDFPRCVKTVGYRLRVMSGIE